MKRIGSLFSGIGGLELGLERAGVGHTLWQVETDTFCKRVLARHWPGAKRHDDVRLVGRGQLDPVDVICGGFPCQDVSSAGKGAGIKEGTRSGLWFEFRRIIGELRPNWVVVENVASGKQRWLSLVREDLEAIGYGTRAFALSAADVGAPHLRRRIFVIASSNPDLLLLREQPGRRSGSRGEGPSLVAEHGEEGSVSNADPKGEHALAQHGEMGGQCTPAAAGWAGWETVPEFRRVDDGVPEELDDPRLKALGNAVVPQCAEVIGRILLDLELGSS